MYNVTEKMEEVQECIAFLPSAATKITHTLCSGWVQEISVLGLKLEVDNGGEYTWFVFTDYEDKLTKENCFMFYEDLIKNVEIYIDVFGNDVIIMTLKTGNHIKIESIPDDSTFEDRWLKIEQSYSQLNII